MEKILYSKPLNAETIIEKKEIINPPFNFKVASFNNDEIVVVSKNQVKILRNIDDSIINPKPRKFMLSKIDENRYTIYFVNGSYHDLKWGGNIEYEDFKVGDIQEKVYIRSVLTYRIFEADKAIKILSSSKKTYDESYINNKLRNKVDNVFKSAVYSSLASKGFVGSQEDIQLISKEIVNKLNEEVLCIYGIEVSSLSLVLEEEVIHSSKRNKLEWNKLNK